MQHFFFQLVDVCSFVLWILVTFFFKAVPCQRYFGGNIVMGANFLRKNVTFSATLFVAIKHPFWLILLREKIKVRHTPIVLDVISVETL